MNRFYNETLSKLETAINELEIEADCSIQRMEAVIHLILECLSEVKEHVLKRGFKNIEEEIRFFKYQKPVILSKLIYYNAIYKIGTKKPYGAKPIRKYLNKELKKQKKNYLPPIYPSVKLLTNWALSNRKVSAVCLKIKRIKVRWSFEEVLINFPISTLSTFLRTLETSRF